MKVIALEKLPNEDFFRFTPMGVEQFLNIIQSGEYRLDNKQSRPFADWVRTSDNLIIRYYGIVDD